jgi:hypothetical protein
VNTDVVNTSMLLTHIQIAQPPNLEVKLTVIVYSYLQQGCMLQMERELHSAAGSSLRRVTAYSDRASHSDIY